MDLSKILSISGKSGLFKVVSQLKNSVLVESLTDKKRFPAFAHEKISSMEEIAVFTVSEDKPLKDVLKSIYEKQEGKAAIDAHSGEKELKEFFTSVVPDYDTDRVYVSDMRKIISWYNILLEHELLDFTEEPAKDDTKNEKTAETAVEEAKPEKEEKEAAPKTPKKSGTAKPSAKPASAPKKRKTEE